MDIRSTHVELLIINVGDFLERASNKVFVSTVHKVVNHICEPRYSVPYFLDPDPQASIEPKCQGQRMAEGIAQQSKADGSEACCILKVRQRLDPMLLVPHLTRFFGRFILDGIQDDHKGGELELLALMSSVCGTIFAADRSGIPAQLCYYGPQMPGHWTALAGD